MQVSKWGNSLAVRLPKSVVEQLQLQAGDELAVVVNDNNQVELQKVDRRKAFIEAMSKFKLVRPEGYKFDRDEANSR